MYICTMLYWYRFKHASIDTSGTPRDIDQKHRETLVLFNRLYCYEYIYTRPVR